GEEIVYSFMMVEIHSEEIDEFRFRSHDRRRLRNSCNNGSVYCRCMCNPLLNRKLYRLKRAGCGKEITYSFVIIKATSEEIDKFLCCFSVHQRFKMIQSLLNKI